MKKIKVLQVCAVDFTLKNLLLPLVDRLSAEGFEVHSVCSVGPEISDLRARGYRIETVQIMRRISPLKNAAAIFRLFRYIKEKKFDVVHVHTPVAAIVGRIAARLAGVPLIVYTAHGFYFHDGMSRWKRELFIVIEKIMGRFFTDIIFTQSEEDRETALKKGIIAADRIFRIGNGVDLQKFTLENIFVSKEDKRREFNISQDAKVIGFIGRIVKEKGIVDLVQAFKKILLEISNARLLIIGDTLSSDRDVTAKQEVLSLIEKNSLEDKIIFAGYRKDINELLSIVDVFVLPSYREGMPRSIIEAMAMGKPVVATNIRGCREEVVDGRTGFLVPAGDPESLSTALIKILTDDKLAREMGREGRSRAMSEFNEKNVLDKQVSLIKHWLRIKAG
ncbi:MAG: glycosyltransferase family 4 protein [Bacillota bacterium]